jgi:hypothetical protein
MYEIDNYPDKDKADLDAHGFPGYILTSTGGVWTNKQQRWLTLDKTGCVLLAYAPQKYSRVSVNVLVGNIFINPPIFNNSCKPLDIDNDYYIYSDGRVWSSKTARWLSPNLVKQYYYINVLGNAYLLHRLVAELFVPNPEGKPEINHINGIKTDNRAENLEWCTRSENMIHAYKNGYLDDSLAKAQAARGIHYDRE